MGRAKKSTGPLEGEPRAEISTGYGLGNAERGVQQTSQN